MSLNIEHVGNWIDSKESYSNSSKWLEKFNPHSGKLQALITDSDKFDVERAVSSACKAFENWSTTSPVARGKLIFEIARLMRHFKTELADCVSLETGKSTSDALGEVEGSILQAEFFAGEGFRLYGRTLTSNLQNKYSQTFRKPIGVAGLIVPANTPIANISWKIFPALICGNTVVLKASEDAPKIAILIAQLAKEAGLPSGALNIVQGSGESAGSALVSNSDVKLISFTGSTIVGRQIAETAGKRLARISLELGGKNPFIVCDDADLDLAIHWAILSAFSNAGQRCASGSRLLIFESIYENFVAQFINRVAQLKLGADSTSDVGPVINRMQQIKILDAIKNATQEGGQLLIGGQKPQDQYLRDGYYIEPTVIANLSLDSEFVKNEVFGPVVSVHKIKNLAEAISESNNSKYGLTAAIHTKNIDRAMQYAHKVEAGVVNINLGTFGSEPHMPFGGFKDSGNGTREPGVEALDFYSELKNISYLIRES